jgi:ABC-type Fe3+ transport system, periplasmic component
MKVMGANAAALEAVTTGEKGILVAGVDYNAYASIDKGEPIKIYYPAGGTVINPRPAMILKTSPNMNNAKAFMDYLLSDEAQKFVADAYLLPGRSDVKATKRPNVSDIKVLDTNWEWMMDNSSAVSKKLIGLCK